MKKLVAIAKAVYANRKAEIALLVACAAAVREIIQGAFGH